MCNLLEILPLGIQTACFAIESQLATEVSAQRFGPTAAGVSEKGDVQPSLHGHR